MCARSSPRMADASCSTPLCAPAACAGGEYIYCSVSFQPEGRTYYYRTDDDTLRPGDWVIVPAGAQNRETRVRVEEVEYFREDELPMPLERVKRVLRRCERRKGLTPALAFCRQTCYNSGTRKGGCAMYDELTEVDIRKMQEEIHYRTTVLRPKIMEDVKTARAFGDLSENYEYKAAKQEQRRCDSRLRYLKRMVATAKVISTDSPADVAGLFDTVTIRYPEDGDTETIRLVTTLRQDALKGLISKESPLGKAVMGRKVGEQAWVDAETGRYCVEIVSIEKGKDDESLPISSF